MAYNSGLFCFCGHFCASRASKFSLKFFNVDALRVIYQAVLPTAMS